MTKRYCQNVGEIVERFGWSLKNGCKNESSLKESFEIPARQIQDEFVKVIRRHFGSKCFLLKSVDSF